MGVAKRVLLVEDEPFIAMMLEDFLDVLGHEFVGVADSVSGALTLIGAGGADNAGIDAVILDVNLRGGEASWPVADHLESIGTPFIIATGGGSDSVVEAHRARPILSKPYSMDAVEAALARI